MQEREVYVFGEFALDVTDRRVSRHGRWIVLPPKALDVLVALVRRAGRLVTKQELLDVVWPDTFVDEGILSVHVSTLRKTLVEREAAPFIETVPRSGYRFTESVMRRRLDPDPFGERWLIPRPSGAARARAHRRRAQPPADGVDVGDPEGPAAFRSAISSIPRTPRRTPARARMLRRGRTAVVPHGEAYDERAARRFAPWP
jgi:DNA-binding winged helix-turn-helix (wHTH) protein